MYVHSMIRSITKNSTRKIGRRIELKGAVVKDNNNTIRSFSSRTTAAIAGTAKDKRGYLHDRATKKNLVRLRETKLDAYKVPRISHSPLSTTTVSSHYDNGGEMDIVGNSRTQHNNVLLSYSVAQQDQFFPRDNSLNLGRPPQEASNTSGILPQEQQDSSSIDFNCSEMTLSSKTNIELLRSLMVFQVCNIPFVVRHANSLLRISRNVLGDTLTRNLVKHTFFEHFCAGEDIKSIQPKVDKLRQSGIGSILDYAAECDMNSEKKERSKNNDHVGSNSQEESSSPFSLSDSNKIIQSELQEQRDGAEVVSTSQPARVYDYTSERQCDLHVETFLSCIESVKQVSSSFPGTGFAAMKVTALGNPILLERMSRAIVEVRELFHKFDTNQDGLLSKAEFVAACAHGQYNHVMLDGSTADGDGNDDDMIDYDKFTKLLPAPSFLTSEERSLMETLYKRAHVVAQEAFDSQVRLLIDAEQHCYQPAIDNLVLELQRKYNQVGKTTAAAVEKPIIFQTYQCYLKETPSKIRSDLERSRKGNYHFAAKLVRGAYLNYERKMAEEKGYTSPVFDTIQETHDSYNQAVRDILKYREEHGLSGLEIMCATHNQESIEKALNLILMKAEASNSLKQAVHFAQLLGMSDNLTYALGQNGYSSYKYVPYGNIDEVMAYLLRRLEENSTVFGNTGKEKEMVKEELKRRVLSSFGGKF